MYWSQDSEHDTVTICYDEKPRSQAIAIVRAQLLLLPEKTSNHWEA